MDGLQEKEKHRIIIEEKTRLHRKISAMRSYELDLIMKEESSMERGRILLRTLFEVMIGAYVGVISILIVLLVLKFFT